VHSQPNVNQEVATASLEECYRCRREQKGDLNHVSARNMTGMLPTYNDEQDYDTLVNVNRAHNQRYGRLEFVATACVRVVKRLIARWG
jgi:hypothetical protein